MMKINHFFSEQVGSCLETVNLLGGIVGNCFFKSVRVTLQLNSNLKFYIELKIQPRDTVDEALRQYAIEFLESNQFTTISET